MPYADKEIAKKKRQEYYLKNKKKMIQSSIESLRARMSDPIYAEERMAKNRKRHHERKNDKDYIESRKKHALKSRLKRQYGITESEYWAMHSKQKGKCMICNRKPTVGVTGSERTLVVDHCHETNKIRGLLCSQCNIMLGMAENKKETFMKAIEYLEKA